MLTASPFDVLETCPPRRPTAGFEHVIFPDLAPSGSRHVINFSPAMPPLAGVNDAAEPDEVEAYLRWVMKQGGLDARYYRWETLRRRLPSVLRALRVSSLAEAQATMRSNRRSLASALSSVLIGVTSFFRDPAVFEAFSQRVLPNLAARGREIRIWSAGCSDGAELYSAAMLLAEHKILQRAKLLGSDCRADALAVAREGVYRDDALKSVPEAFRFKYFRQNRRQWHIVEWIRASARWEKNDLLTSAEPGLWDVVFCRNVAIYFHPSATGQLWTRLRAGLRVGGILVLGKAERPFTGGFRQIGPCLFERDRS